MRWKDAFLEPKEERDQDGLRLRIPYRQPLSGARLFADR